MKLRTFLDLARISNLPTVWSNVLAGAVIASPSPAPARIAVAGIAGSLLYSGGMFLNDAFDAEIDARERPERPIPSGRVTRASVLRLGFGMLALALASLAVFSGASSIVAGLSIAAGVVVYDRWHKGVAWSPVVMGFCRAGLYALGALGAAPRFGHDVVLSASSLLLYVVGLTYVARFENASAVGRAWPTAFVFAPLAVLALNADFANDRGERLAVLAAVVAAHVAWTLRALVIALRGGRGAIPRAVVALIAGISLVDAAFIALAGASTGVAAAVAAFALTLFLQRWVRGT
ncbi:MAG TPA: UbiA family prenyltransferase [Polyangiaceae bacterium]